MRSRIATGVLALSFLALAGCVSILDGMWEQEARANCDRESGQSRRSDCNDRVDEQTRRQSRN